MIKSTGKYYDKRGLSQMFLAYDESGKYLGSFGTRKQAKEATKHERQNQRTTV